MNLHWIDWAIVAFAVIALRFVSLSTRKHCKGVADFLSANRSAGRYLLTIASSMGGMGVISFVAMFEVYYQAGLPPIWWGLMALFVYPILYLSGWVYWRLRETRALTMAQFFEMRYSRRFRVFAGIVMWVCGIVNFGIFPAVAARFFVYFCGLPPTFMIHGLPFHFSTFASVMALDLGLALMFVTMGGQISVMITECVQGIFSNIAFVIILACVLLMVPWSHIIQALSSAPADASMLHPYHTGNVKDFNIWFYLIGIFSSFYSCNSWQGGSGFNSAGRTPHETQMGTIISVWRQVPVVLLMLLLPLAALAVLNLPEYSTQATHVNAILDSISPSAKDEIRRQMVVPIAMGQLLPIGIKGLLATTFLFFSFTCHDTYMHSWGSIFIQDVVMPFRKTKLSPRAHINLLRFSIAFVAVFSFLFSLLYAQSSHILMFFAITGTIWVGGSGAVIIGGLYWKRGTTPAAYTAVISGAVLGLCGLFCNQIWQFFFKVDFPINGQWLMFVAMVFSLILYVVVSLLTGGTHKAVNMEKLLHRGKYKVASEQMESKAPVRSIWLRLMGITEHFSLSDKILSVALVVWNLGWFATFLIITAIHFTFDTSVEWWAKFWHFYVVMQFCIGVPATIWFTIGGIHDIRALFKTLANVVRDDSDDGSVKHEADDEIVELPPGVAANAGEILDLATGEEVVEPEAEEEGRPQ
jgi:solute:Na+ symporter, SSS family